jgi:ABC-2 type transport system ATP-binding protein
MRLRGVGRRYGLRAPWVLRDIDADLAPGVLHRVAGPNGCGKSTLLRLLAGIDAPSAGEITGRPDRCAYVPERFSAALPFTAAGYLTHLARVRGTRGRQAQRSALEWLERFGAAAHARTPMGELSKGSSQKVAVAQALLAGPDLLVLDEAWTGLDQDARGELDRAVAERLTAGATVVYVDHAPERLAGAAPAELLLSAGTVAGTGPGAGETVPADTRVTITAAGPPGAAPPSGLPAPAVTAPGPGGTTLVTVPAAFSDTALRVLLTARPPWHVHAVEPPPAAPPADEDGGTP